MKNIRIFLLLCELNLKKLFVYRASFFISLVLMSIWVLAYGTLIEVIFYHTKTLAGWNKGQVFIVMSFYYFIQNISEIFFKDNFEHFGETVRRGELDFKLLKPVSTRLLASFWEIRFDHAASIIPTILLFIHGLNNLPTVLSLPHLGLGVAMMSISLILYFSILSMIATLTFWIERNDTFNVLIFNISQLSRYPRPIYTAIVGKILTFGLPLALIASIPAEIALSISTPFLVYYFVGITLVFYVASRIMWNVGLRNYTSAN